MPIKSNAFQIKPIWSWPIVHLRKLALSLVSAEKRIWAFISSTVVDFLNVERKSPRCYEGRNSDSRDSVPVDRRKQRVNKTNMTWESMKVFGGHNSRLIDSGFNAGPDCQGRQRPIVGSGK